MKTKLTWINYAGRLESACGRFTIAPAMRLFVLRDRGTVVARGFKADLKALAICKARGEGAV